MNLYAYNIHVLVDGCNNEGFIMTVCVYGPDSYKEYLQGQFDAIEHRANLKIQKVNNATIWPVGKPRERGVYNAAHKYIDASSIIIDDRANLRRPRRYAALYIDEDVLFLGDLHHHFGHVLLERLTRAWALMDKKFHNMKCAVLYSKAADPLPEYYVEFLRALGVRSENIIVVARPTRFRTVFVPDISKGPFFYSDAYARTFDAIATATPDRPVHDKIYMSRGALEHRRTFGEKIIQTVFERNGFRVIYPETMHIRDQIALVKNCRVLAGCAGTALHLALFMKPGGQVIQIKRNSKNEDNAREQFLINRSKNLSSVFIWASDEKYPTPHFTNAPQIIYAGHYMRCFWTEARFKYSPKSFDGYADEYAQYLAAWGEYRRTHGVGRKVKRTLIKIMACVIPGRERRGNFRARMKRALRCA